MKNTLTLLLVVLSLTSCLTSKQKETTNLSNPNINSTETYNSGNQSTLSNVALNDNDTEVRKLAVSKLIIQSTLSNVALNDKDAEVRKLAIKRLN